MARGLLGRVAIVTGGAGAIGAAIAERLRDEGADVVISDIDEVAGVAVAARAGASFHHCDVSDAEQARELVAQTEARFGRVDILASNAGIAQAAPFLDLTNEMFNRTVAVNLAGCFYVCQAAARAMVRVAQGGGRPGSIVATSSVAAQQAHPALVHYSASKGGVAMLVAGMAVALAQYGIRVNAVGPGTTLGAERNVGLEGTPRGRDLLSRTPLGRFAQASEIAAVVAFLASDEASYVTGQTLYADGGRLALNGIVPPSA